MIFGMSIAWINERDDCAGEEVGESAYTKVNYMLFMGFLWSQVIFYIFLLTMFAIFFFYAILCWYFGWPFFGQDIRRFQENPEEDEGLTENEIARLKEIVYDLEF